MKEFKVFIDGAEGTTGLRIHQRLGAQAAVKVISLPEETRKDLNARLEQIELADVSILCLPDFAAKEIASLAPKNARICDTSTAHRTNPAWVYGFAELANRQEALKTATRVAVPGCHATGFISLVAPLVEQNVIDKTALLYCHSLTGYSGGGKKMIAEYENGKLPKGYEAPRLYSLAMNHKHLPEMAAITGLSTPPMFTPVVANFYSGMLVSVPLKAALINGTAKSRQAVCNVLQAYYANKPLIKVHNAGFAPENKTISAAEMAGQDSLEIFVLGNDEDIVLCALFDNLGKGASGAAIQCMNLMLNLPETNGLCFGQC